MMPWRLGSAWDNLDRLGEVWRSATPFRHLVIDGLVPAGSLDALMAVLEEEPVEHRQADIYAFDASAPEPATDALRELREAFATTFAPPLSVITGKALRRADMRAYAYRAGDFLLPHTDHQSGVGRLLAYAFYLPSPEPPVGGELELFRCELEAGEVVLTESARLVAPTANRMVVFDVGDSSLHQVREVLGGIRPSLAGWFHA